MRTGTCSAFFRQSIITAGLLAVLSPVLASPPPSQIAGDLQQVVPSGTPEQDVARVIENICPAIDPSVGDLKTQCDAIVGEVLGAGDITGAVAGLRGMAAEETSAIEGTTVDAQVGSKDAVQTRMAGVRSGLASLGGSTLTLNGRTLSAQALFGNGLGDGLAAGDGFGGWSFYVNGGYAHADRDATPRESGFELDDFRVTAGVDYQTGGRWLVGGAVHYSAADADLDAAGGTLEVDSLGASLYASFYPSASTYIDAVVSYYRNDYDQDRNIRYVIAGNAPVNQTATSSFDADDLSATVTAGYDFVSGSLRYGPYGRLTVARVDTDAFRETMSSPGAPGSGLATQIDSKETTSVPLSIGVQASRSFSTGWGSITPQAFVEYVHEFDNDASPTTGFFVDDPFQERFALPTDSTDRNYALFGVSVAAQFARNATAQLTYQGLAGYRDLTVHAVVLGMRMDW